jgi:drug/metabolite transporter (DMT)-like permease
MIAAGIFFFPLGLILNEHQHFSFDAVSMRSLLALIYLMLMGSIIAYLAYMWLLSVRPASLVGTYAYVNPVVAVFLGWLIAHETVSPQQAIGLCVIIAGLAIVNLSKEKKIVKEKANHQEAE